MRDAADDIKDIEKQERTEKELRVAEMETNKAMCVPTTSQYHCITESSTDWKLLLVRQEPVEALQGDSFAPSTHVVPRREGKEESCEEVARGTNRDAMLLASIMLSSGVI